MRGVETSLHDAQGSFCELPTTDGGPLQDAIRFEEEQKVRKIVEALPPVMGEVVRRRFCIGGSPFATQYQLAEELGVTQQRVQQIEQDALSCHLPEMLIGLEGF